MRPALRGPQAPGGVASGRVRSRGVRRIRHLPCIRTARLVGPAFGNPKGKSSGVVPAAARQITPGSSASNVLWSTLDLNPAFVRVSEAAGGAHVGNVSWVVGHGLVGAMSADGGTFQSLCLGGILRTSTEFTKALSTVPVPRCCCAVYDGGRKGSGLRRFRGATWRTRSYRWNGIATAWKGCSPQCCSVVCSASWSQRQRQPSLQRPSGTPRRIAGVLAGLWQLVLHHALDADRRWRSQRDARRGRRRGRWQQHRSRKRIEHGCRRSRGKVIGLVHGISGESVAAYVGCGGGGGGATPAARRSPGDPVAPDIPQAATAASRHRLQPVGWRCRRRFERDLCVRERQCPLRHAPWHIGRRRWRRRRWLHGERRERRQWELRSHHRRSGNVGVQSLGPRRRLSGQGFGGGGGGSDSKCRRRGAGEAAGGRRRFGPRPLRPRVAREQLTAPAARRSRLERRQRPGRYRRIGSRRLRVGRRWGHGDRRQQPPGRRRWRWGLLRRRQRRLQRLHALHPPSVRVAAGPAPRGRPRPT